MATDQEINDLADINQDRSLRYMIEYKKADDDKEGYRVTTNEDLARKLTRSMAREARYKKNSILLHKIRILETWTPKTEIVFESDQKEE